MGAAVSCAALRVKNNKNATPYFRIDPVLLTKEEATRILTKPDQKAGTYLLYEDVRREGIWLSFRTTGGEVVHHSIVRLNDLFYFNDFPFPYLESIVLYYRKYKFNDTKLTHQAILSPQIKSQRSKRLSAYLKLDAQQDTERDSHV